MKFEALRSPNSNNLNNDESKHVSRKEEHSIVFDTLEKETGITIKILNKIHESPHLKKYFMLALATVGFFSTAEINASQLDSIKSNEEIGIHKSVESKPTKESLVNLINLIQEKNIFECESYGVCYANLGKYEIEYQDKNKNNKLESDTERFSLMYENEKGNKVFIGSKFGNFSAIELNANPQSEEGFIRLSKQDIYKKYNAVFTALGDNETANVRELSMQEVNQIVKNAEINLPK